MVAATTTTLRAASVSYTLVLASAAGYEGKPFPEPPQTIKALTRARNRTAALDTACGGGGASLGLFPYEREALLERGELVSHSPSSSVGSLCPTLW
jgi:hypothetical protein